MSALPLLYEKQEGIAYITLNRPEARNALSPEVVCRLADAFVDYARDDSLRVAIITGAGDKAFCAGGDLGSMLPLLTGARAPADEWDRRVLGEPLVMAASSLRDFHLAKPVIAAINGLCFAAGAELILGTDMRVAAAHAMFGFPEAKRGLIPFAGSTVRLARQVPYAVALEMMMTGDPIDAATAHRIGLVNHVVPASEVMEKAKVIARVIAANGPLAVQRIKQAVVATSGLPLEQAYAVENRSKDAVFASDDAKEGPRSFMEKRPPRFTGR
jgi:enoyl-CoA hydratase/carnithine racemase